MTDSTPHSPPHSPKEKPPTAPKPDDAPARKTRDPHDQALKYKAFRHIFSEKDIRKGMDEKTMRRKLRRSDSMIDRYHQYVAMRDDKEAKNQIYPWRNPFNRMLFGTVYWSPRLLKWGILSLLLLVVINYIPGPTQHIMEVLLARTIYDVAPIARLPENLENYAHSARIVDRQGAVIKAYGKRQVTIEVPQPARLAVLACEDHHFLPHPKNPWHINAFRIHPGVSWPNIMGAVRDAFRGRTRGASTVVMQNAKKILGNSERTIANKLEEIIIAYMMVAKFGKEKNLDFYLNTVPVGANIYGFPAAAENYFKKDLAELNYQQLAAIGAFIPNHHRQVAIYRIVKGASLAELEPSLAEHARAAINKVNLALAHLHGQGEISDSELAAWRLNDEESIRRVGFRDFRSPLYGEEEWTSWNVIKEVTARSYRIGNREVSGSQLILDERGDVIIETAVDLELAETAKNAISGFLGGTAYREVLRRSNRNLWQRDLERFRKMQQEPPYRDFESFMAHLEQHINVGLIAINQQGEVVAYVGGKEFLSGGGDGQNPLDSAGPEEESPETNPVIIDLMNQQAKISPSSTIKPVIAYYAMVAANAKPEDLFADQPLEYKYVEEENRQVWLPRNWYDYDANRFLGRRYSLTEAQVLSVNTIFARLYGNRQVQNAMLSAFDKIGLEYSREDAKYWPFGIGASEVPVRQWLGVYNAFLDGNYREPTFVRRILVNDQVIYQREADPSRRPRPLFDARREREAEMGILYEICNRGTGAGMKGNFKYHKNLVSGKTGTAPLGRSSLFISHFNPHRDRQRHPEDTLTMLVAFTTNTGGFKSVGNSTDGPVKLAGEIYQHLFQKKLQEMMDAKMEEAKQNNAQFRNNHVYWANVNRYMDALLNEKCGPTPIHENVVGVDGFAEAMTQILNSNNQIYTGRDHIFQELVRYYCDQERVIKMN